MPAGDSARYACLRSNTADKAHAVSLMESFCSRDCLYRRLAIGDGTSSVLCKHVSPDVISSTRGVVLRLSHIIACLAQNWRHQGLDKKVSHPVTLHGALCMQASATRTDVRLKIALTVAVQETEVASGSGWNTRICQISSTRLCPAQRADAASLWHSKKSCKSLA